MPTKNKANDICITRVYDAPIKTVWDAWTDPDQVAKWWGPRGFTLTTHSKDLRPGGIWNYTMHGPDGVDYPNKTLYHEVEEFKKLVYDHGANDERPPMFRVTVLFSETGGKTTMEMTMTLPTAAEAEATRKFIKQAGGNATWDRLAEYLDEQTTGRNCFVINRTFDASQEVVFRMWTDADHLSKWLPPSGFAMEFLRADIKPGGSVFFRMFNQADISLFGRMEYKEVFKPCRLVYTQQFCDEHESISRHPGLPIWPETILVTVLFVAEGLDQTRVTVTSEPFGDTTSEEVTEFLGTRSSMTQGWSGAFDQLEALLA